jgi:acyl-CoA synthetase (AMP-forming)/AMP-acid ligase II
VEDGCIIVPLTSSVAAKKAEFTQISQGEVTMELNPADVVTIRRTGLRADHELYGKLRQPCHPGLVLFSSGSTGKSKGVVHDLLPMLEKYKVSRTALRSISFLLFDHIGGVNTMLYILANAGCMVTVQERTPEAVLAAIQNHKVELLPTSPTFINLIILSEAWKSFDLSTLKTVTYGTEPMLDGTLKRFHELFPHIKLQQTYGLSEVGILRSQSRSSDSLWVRLGGEGFETRIVDGVFQIKAKSAMLGYLNAPSPFTADGWFNTGDMVEVDGDYVRFLGRKSEIINVGGEKVYPAEVENVLQALNNVAEVTVFGEKHPLTGHIVAACFRLLEPEDPAAFRNRVRAFCQGKIERHKIPARILIVGDVQHSSRFKKMRRAG